MIIVIGHLVVLLASQPNFYFSVHRTLSIATANTSVMLH
jgi:hypothetical protein